MSPNTTIETPNRIKTVCSRRKTMKRAMTIAGNVHGGRSKRCATLSSASPQARRKHRPGMGLAADRGPRTTPETERPMHKIAIPAHATERALSRRGGLHPFAGLDPARTALVVVDLQNGFMAPGQPAEIAFAREIVPNVNQLAAVTRAAGGAVVWIQNTIDAESRSEERRVGKECRS